MVNEFANDQWVVEMSKIEKRVDRYENKGKAKKLKNENSGSNGGLGDDNSGPSSMGSSWIQNLNHTNEPDSIGFKSNDSVVSPSLLMASDNATTASHGIQIGHTMNYGTVMSLSNSGKRNSNNQGSSLRKGSLVVINKIIQSGTPSPTRESLPPRNSTTGGSPTQGKVRIALPSSVHNTSSIHNRRSVISLSSPHISNGSSATFANINTPNVTSAYPNTSAYRPPTEKSCNIVVGSLGKVKSYIQSSNNPSSEENSDYEEDDESSIIEYQEHIRYI